ncbi:hypothetical protein L4D06_19335 [Enterovibrio makurazakiensis]|uniref:Lipoprotein n=1 Tax=Enterovibrio gelatinilyticus TaxID=2899819 RepID=A0ABT5R0F4_9GAMM|nr:hypothetical protein [Enterovibrio sp. ZSDZ42]MDD1793760.1 hypothetical protein [Enterovibrio sp. ZSDZ42]
MKKQTFAIVLTMMLTGCASNDLGQVVNEGVNGAINGVLGSVGSAPVINSDKGYTIEEEAIYTTNATRTKKDYGSIEITKTQKNPKSKTEIYLQSCVHPRIGAVDCDGYLYEVTSEGWLLDDKVLFNSSNYQSRVIASGTYYFKLESEKTGTDYHATGEATIVPFVTNYITITVE